MKERYKILYKGGEAEIVEKKSRFIASLCPVSSEEEAVSFINEMKKKYWDAGHHCSAFVIGDQGQISRCSDDGEPAQTAGRPMLDVLSGAEIRDACAVVTRYFGGTLLGTGGLVRAYSGAVQEGLRQCVVLEKCLAERLKLSTDYSGLGKVQYLLAEAGITTMDSEYGENVELTVLAPVDEAEALKKKLIEGTSGRCGIERLDHVYFGLDQGKIILLD